MSLADRFRDVFALGPSEMALEFEGRDHTWAELGEFAAAIRAALSQAGVERGDVIGWVALNVPSTVASLAALTLSECCAACINAHMGSAVLADEIRENRFPAIIADQGFWETRGITDAVRDAGTAGLEVGWDASGWSVVPLAGLERVIEGPHRDRMPLVAMERLSSGTTGPPKRVPIRYDEVERAIVMGEHREQARGAEPLALHRSPAIVLRPLAHGAGSFAVLMALYSGRPISLHRKFSVEGLVAATSRHRPKVVSLVPAMIARILEAGVPPAALSSLIAVRCGTAPLPPRMQEEFESRFGVPVLIDYGATEFGGAAGWSLADHKKYAKTKRGSVGRAMAGVELRVVEPTTRQQVPDGTIGVLEVRSGGHGDEWISTADLASIDEDGFLFIHGRADDAIVRGGFKVLPDEVANVLRLHPGVRDAFVVGVPDVTLGHVPVALIETFDDRAVPEEASLRAFARDRLTPYQVPIAFRFVDHLPRTETMKVLRAEAVALAQQARG